MVIFLIVRSDQKNQQKPLRPSRLGGSEIKQCMFSTKVPQNDLNPNS